VNNIAIYFYSAPFCSFFLSFTLSFNKFVVLRVSFADEKSQKSPQVKTLSAVIFFGRVQGFSTVFDVESRKPFNLSVYSRFQILN